MSDEKDVKEQEAITDADFKLLVESHDFKIPQAGETVIGTVISASKSEVKLDIAGVLVGVVRARELYAEADEYADLKPGDEVEATVVEAENENGELELSFKFAGQEKAWNGLREAYKNRTIIKVKVTDANKGGLLVHYRQIYGFLPVSQLAPDNYPRVNGGDKTKILEKLKSFVGRDLEVKPIALEEKEEKIIFSEKEAWNELQKDIIAKYKVATVVEGRITAVTDFGVFVSFGENLEGLIHISELAWQRIDDPADLYKVGDPIKAEVISLDGSKIFLSAKKLLKDPWQEVEAKFRVGQIIRGAVLKINPFGLFVRLDDDIHGLAHVSQLNLAPGQKVMEAYRPGDEHHFEIVSIEPREHRMGLKAVAGESQSAPVAAQEKPAKKKAKKEDDDAETGEATEVTEAKEATEGKDDEEDEEKKPAKKKGKK